MFSNILPTSPGSDSYRELSDGLQNRGWIAASASARDQILFDALDGQTIDGGAWTVRVYAVHQRAGTRFVQLALTADTTVNLVAKLSATAGPIDVLAALEEWVADSDPSTSILNVA